MSLFEDLLSALPELEQTDAFLQNKIILQNDSDGTDDYIVKWDYLTPMPQGFKIGK